MAFCPNCGTQTSGRFCPNCGTDLGAAGAATPGVPPTGTAWTDVPPSPNVSAPGMTDNLASALCYLLGLITGIIFLVLSPYNANRTVRFHAWQSIFFSLGAFLINWILRIVIWSVLHLGAVGFALMSLVNLGWFVLWLVLILSAYRGRTIRLPLVGDLAAKQA